MPTYISLINLTHQGVTGIKEGPARLETGKDTLKAFGSEGSLPDHGRGSALRPNRQGGGRTLEHTRPEGDNKGKRTLNRSDWRIW